MPYPASSPCEIPMSHVIRLAPSISMYFYHPSTSASSSRLMEPESSLSKFLKAWEWQLGRGKLTLRA